jgi:ribosomal protein S18 acetylase RimI-like enzyme
LAVPPEPPDLDQPRPKQLRMVRPNLLDLPPIVTLDGFDLRTYRPGDEATWAEMMNSPEGIGTGWTVELVRQKLITQPQFEPACLFFAEEAASGLTVATATAWRVRPDDHHVGHLHMVAALPDYRGRGLGRLVCAAALSFLRDRGFQSAVLTTDDSRLPAIATYLGLGFVPEYWEDRASDQRARWSAVFRHLPDRRRHGASTDSPGKNE